MKQAETSADFHLTTRPMKVGRRFAVTCRPHLLGWRASKKDKQETGMKHAETSADFHLITRFYIAEIEFFITENFYLVFVCHRQSTELCIIQNIQNPQAKNVQCVMFHTLPKHSIQYWTSHRQCIKYGWKKWSRHKSFIPGKMGSPSTARSLTCDVFKDSEQQQQDYLKDERPTIHTSGGEYFFCSF